MKKILAAFDGLKYSTATCDYAMHLAQMTHAHLVAVFLDDITYTSYRIYDLVGKEGVSQQRLTELQQADQEKRKAAAEQFEQACQKKGISYAVHHDRNVAIHELKHESIYTDLLVIDRRETLTHYTEKLPTRFIRDLLVDTQSPVLLVPARYKPIEKLILLYDGEPGSVYAIKMLSYLLPQLKQLETEVISVNPTQSSLHLPDNRLMKEFMKRHFPKAKYTVLKGLPEEEILKRLEAEKMNALVVLGAYRRGAVSRLFRESMADRLMKSTKLPLFVAHGK